MRRFIYFLCVVLLPLPLFAATVGIEGADTLSLGNQSQVSIFVQTDGVSINAFEGTLHIPDGVSVVSVSDARSIISLWTSTPRIEEGRVRIEGVIPGGVTTEHGVLLDLIVTTDVLPVTGFSWSDVKAYTNDGKGSEVPIVAPAYAVSLTNDAVLPLPTDTEPPEPFVVNIVREDVLFDGAYGAVFSTKDKQSGIAYYEIQEHDTRTPTDDAWRPMASPAVLVNQQPASFVSVRAVDNAGNIRIATTATQGSRIPVGILIVVLIVILLYVFKKYRKNA